MLMSATGLRGIDATEEAVLLGVAHLLTLEDMRANATDSTLLLNDRNRVLAAAVRRGIDTNEEAALLGVAKSMANANDALKRANQTPFEDWLLDLKNYKQKHGQFPTDQSTPLGNWVKRQRKLKRKCDRGKRMGGMDSDRVLKLNALVFCVGPTAARQSQLKRSEIKVKNKYNFAFKLSVEGQVPHGGGRRLAYTIAYAIHINSLYQPLGSKTRLQHKKTDGLNFGLEWS
jgi:hypothetical protein